MRVCEYVLPIFPRFSPKANCVARRQNEIEKYWGERPEIYVFQRSAQIHISRARAAFYLRTPGIASLTTLKSNFAATATDKDGPAHQMNQFGDNYGGRKTPH